MAIANVAQGAFAAVAAASVSPAFGAATTAGNLLIACVTANTNAAIPTPTGWSSAISQSGLATTRAAIFYKANCGASETAPSFTNTGATYMAAMLTEWSGADTVAPKDAASAAAGTSPTNGANDASNSDLLIYALTNTASKSCTLTFSETWTPSGGTDVVVADDASTKQIQHSRFLHHLIAGNGGSSHDAMSELLGFSTGVSSENSSVLCSFKPASGGGTGVLPAQPRVVGQAVQRAATRCWKRRPSGIVVPRLWTPDGLATI